MVMNKVLNRNSSNDKRQHALEIFPNNITSCPLSFAQNCALVLSIARWAKEKHFHVYQISSFYLGEYYK
jgi:hypothetical protein